MPGKTTPLPTGVPESFAKTEGATGGLEVCANTFGFTWMRVVGSTGAPFCKVVAFTVVMHPAPEQIGTSCIHNGKAASPTALLRSMCSPTPDTNSTDPSRKVSTLLQRRAPSHNHSRESRPTHHIRPDHSSHRLEIPALQVGRSRRAWFAHRAAEPICPTRLSRCRAKYQRPSASWCRIPEPYPW